MRRTFPLAALALLAGCASMSPEAKVRARLIEAGLKPPMAECMADKLVRHLTIAQLRRLGEVAKTPGQDVSRLTVGQLVERVDAIGDPQIVTVVTRAGIGCAIAG